MSTPFKILLYYTMMSTTHASDPQMNTKSCMATLSHLQKQSDKSKVSDARFCTNYSHRAQVRVCFCLHFCGPHRVCHTVVQRFRNPGS